MKFLHRLAALASLSATAALAADADFASQTVAYELDGVSFESVIVRKRGDKASKPGLLMIPNWMGPTENAIVKAQRAAGDKYIVMVVDMYGVDTRPKNGQEAGAAAGTVRADRNMMRARAQKALDTFKSEGKALGLDPDRIAAFGFCFGGGAALELGRSGTELDAIISFHGDFLSPTLDADAGKTKAKVLALHGADDPYVPQDHVASFVSAMMKTDVDWQLVQYSGAVHSFTDPTADSDGARYHPIVAERAFTAMQALLDEVWSE